VSRPAVTSAGYERFATDVQQKADAERLSAGEARDLADMTAELPKDFEPLIAETEGRS
jgi:hypothetical protein